MRYLDKITYTKTAGFFGGAEKLGKDTGKWLVGGSKYFTDKEIPDKVFSNFEPGVILNAVGTGIGSAAGSVGKNIIDSLFKPKPSIWDSVSKVLQTVGIGVGIGGGMVGLSSLIDRYNLHRQHVNSPMLLQDVLLKNSDVNEVYLSGDAGREKVEDLYKVLEHFSPKIAENSLAAGTFIRQYLKYGDLGANTDAIETLSRITKNITDTKGGNFAHATMGKLFEGGVGASYHSEIKE